MARMPAIDDAQARAAAELALALEREMGRPVDLELAWAGADLFLLQCRPITTL
jgi:pyruvate,water dikinase